MTEWIEMSERETEYPEEVLGYWSYNFTTHVCWRGHDMAGKSVWFSATAAKRLKSPDYCMEIPDRPK